MGFDEMTKMRWRGGVEGALSSKGDGAGIACLGKFHRWRALFKSWSEKAALAVLQASLTLLWRSWSLAS